ncbi:thiol-disulfide isomerase/thioredoxin [Pedobacter africanus]|uniref:Thiol-disulfide isomerase/thioredoxin n=1 Tax=Pedobacter africanus TaxID=151894 RepID=A0ACC6KVW7_9SPHI|nr:TlpA disulfide reductase family protein [Pedobacter africanus]MDR6783300.1 thiol-disulfide isomerase/thioredoxin [Pedobacter africanus]
MKKLIYIITLLCCSINVLAQGNTKISGTVANAKDSLLNINIQIKGLLDDKDYKLATRTGNFELKFNIDRPTQVAIIINDNFVFFPGVFNILVEPGDNIHIAIPELKRNLGYPWGITKLSFSGKGSEKINLLQSAVVSSFKIWNSEPNYQKQSLTYKYESADRKLSLIDSVFNTFKGNVSINAKNIMKASLYDGILDMLFYSSVYTENDSLRFLFNKYIIEKSRVDVFFIDNVIYYEGFKTISNYIVLSEFNNPVYVGGESFRKKNRFSIAKMSLKRVNGKPIVRDYLLSMCLLEDFKSRLDESALKEFYQFYLNNADPKNPLYGEVKSTYEHVQYNLASGKPFFNFSLPDPSGKIYQLADFNGKVLVFDFWFNGCSGCKQMVPVMEELEKEYHGKNIEFVSVNVDKRADWLGGVGKYSSKSSLQLYTEEKRFDHPFIKYLNFTAYPKLIVVDKDGNMGGTPPDPRSDKAGFKKFVDKYL